jgi:muconate cycloisomerase
MSASTIRRITATPVVVPAHPDSLNSAGVVGEDLAFLTKFKLGATWSDFVHQPKWIVTLETDAGAIGIGETYRTVDAHEIEPLLPVLLGRDILAMDWRQLPIPHCRVVDAFESAVLDAAGKHLTLPVHQLLGGKVRDTIACLGWTARRTPADAGRKAKEALDRGHTLFKFKIDDTDAPAAWLDAIRATCGTEMKVILDPNQRWHDVATTRRLMEGVDRELLYCLEDPIDRQDYAGHRTIRRELGVPVFLHVALPYLHQGQRIDDTLTALREDCCDGFNFNGPMFAFVELCRIAQIAGKPVWHGSEVDLGILETNYLHACAAAPACTVPSDIFGPLVRVDDLIEGDGVRIENGFAAVPDGPGLGITLDRAALATYRSGPTLEVTR